MIDSVLLTIDYNRALSRAARLEDMADQIERLVKRKFENSIDELGANWRGENADMFLVKAEELKGELAGKAIELRNLATSIRRAAKAYYDAEMAAEAILDT